jgi:hypothetical protein
VGRGDRGNREWGIVEWGIVEWGMVEGGGEEGGSVDRRRERGVIKVKGERHTVRKGRSQEVHKVWSTSWNMSAHVFSRAQSSVCIHIFSHP